MKNRNEIPCKEIWELLLDQSRSELSGSIKGHLETCQKCREFQKLLTEISNYTQISSEENLQPDPRILKLLKKNFKSQTASYMLKQRGRFFDPLLALFQKRIPIYQVLLAMFIAAIVYFSITKINISNTKPDELNFSAKGESQTTQLNKSLRDRSTNLQVDLRSHGEESVDRSTRRLVEFPVQTQLDQAHQIGRSLAEDSLLAKFRVSIL